MDDLSPISEERPNERGANRLTAEGAEKKGGHARSERPIHRDRDREREGKWGKSQSLVILLPHSMHHFTTAFRRWRRVRGQQPAS